MNNTTTMAEPLMTTLGGNSVLAYVTMLTISVINIGIITVMLSGIWMNKPLVNVHILSLSISDQILGLLLGLLSFVRGSLSTTYNHCFVVHFVFFIIFLTSTFHVCCICVDRCILLTKMAPFTIHQAKQRFIFIVFFSWITPLILMLPPFACFYERKEIFQCHLYELFATNYKWILRYFSMLFLLAVIVIVTSSACVIRFLCTKRRRTVPAELVLNTISANVAIDRSKPVQNAPRIQRLSTKHTYAAWTVAAVGALFSALLTPLVLTLLLEGWIPDYNACFCVKYTSLYVACLHCALNPIVYSVRNPEFINNLKSWKRKCCPLR